jgi:hypothetical protein
MKLTVALEPIDDSVDHGLDVARFDEDRRGADVAQRIRRDVESGIASAASTPTPCWRY